MDATASISNGVLGQLNDDLAKESMRRRYLVRRFLASAGGFWGPHGDATARLLSGAPAGVVVLDPKSQDMLMEGLLPRAL